MRHVVPILLACGLATGCNSVDDPTFEGGSPTDLPVAPASLSVSATGDVPMTFSGPSVCDDTSGRLYLDSNVDTGLTIGSGEVDGESIAHIEFVVDVSGEAELRAMHGNATTFFTGTLGRDPRGDSWGTSGSLNGDLTDDSGNTTTLTATYRC